MLQLRLLRCGECAAHHRVAVTKCDFARRDPAHFASYPIVNLVPECEVSQYPVLRGRSEVDVLQVDLVQVSFDVPPVPRLIAGNHSREKILGLVQRDLGRIGLQRHDPVRRVGQHQQVAATQLPQIARSVLDGGGISGGHQRAHVGQVRQQRRRALQRFFTLFLKISEGENRVFKIAQDFRPHLLLDCMPHNQQGCERQRSRDQHHRE